MRVLFNLLLVSLLLFNSCINETVESAKKLSIENDFKWIEVNSGYRIKVPSYMEQTTILNDEASLQQMDLFKEEYIIIIDESKQEFIDAFMELNSYNDLNSPLDNFHDVQKIHFTEMMNLRPTMKAKKVELNNISAYYIECEAKIEDTDESASYFIYHAESNSKLYTIMAWTLKDNRNIYREKVKKMASTFSSSL